MRLRWAAWLNVRVKELQTATSSRSRVSSAAYREVRLHTRLLQACVRASPPQCLRIHGGRTVVPMTPPVHPRPCRPRNGNRPQAIRDGWAGEASFMQVAAGRGNSWPRLAASFLRESQRHSRTAGRNPCCVQHPGDLSVGVSGYDMSAFAGAPRTYSARGGRGSFLFVVRHSLAHIMGHRVRAFACGTGGVGRAFGTSCPAPLALSRVRFVRYGLFAALSAVTTARQGGARRPPRPGFAPPTPRQDRHTGR